MGSVSRNPTPVIACRRRRSGLTWTGKRRFATSKMDRRAIPWFQSDCQNWVHIPATERLSLLPNKAIQTSTRPSKSGISSTATSSTRLIRRPIIIKYINEYKISQKQTFQDGAIGNGIQVSNRRACLPCNSRDKQRRSREKGLHQVKQSCIRIQARFYHLGVDRFSVIGIGSS